MKIIKIWNDNPSERQLDEVAQYLMADEIAIIPTDTTYALAADALNIKAIEKLCRLKNINPDKTNLSIICHDIAMAAEYARIENHAYKLMREVTPGPFTFLLRAASTLPKTFKRRKIVGIRIPANNFARELSKRLQHPLLVSTIEYEDEDEDYARNPELIEETYYNTVDILVDGGDGSTELSTIVDCCDNEIEIVRQGCGILP